MTAPRIDLHTHSTASDGTDSPTELIRAAHAAGLGVVAITDHDTTGGWAAAASALPAGLTLVRGAELSCVAEPTARFPAWDRVTLHLLAYLFDPDDPAFVAQRRALRESRVERGRQIVERMAADGLPVSWATVSALAGSGSVGRPHVARALVGAGVVASVDEAFQRFLYSGSPYYVPKADLEVLAAVRLVRAAGGVPVFAHPLARRRGRVVPDEVIVAMAGAGLGGLEADHPDHDPADRAHLRALAADLGLFVTGSSDYHGTNKVVTLGQESTSLSAYEELMAQATGVEPLTR